MPICMEPTCTNQASPRHRRFCKNCYERRRRKGTLPPRLSSKERFWQKVDKSTDHWTWTGAKNPSGYGAAWDGKRVIGAHRLSYIYKNGDIPNDMYVCHTCDIPLCVNPDHLFLGTHSDNMADMSSKKRKHGLPGILNPSSVLSEEDIKLILERKKDGISGHTIAKELGVGSSTIYRVLKGDTWKHLTT